jgi:hypothetical protein
LTAGEEEGNISVMNPLVSLLEQRVKDARQRMEEAKAELEDYERALARERNKEQPDEEKDLTFTDRLLGFLKSMALQGTTYKEITEFFERSKVEVGKNFIYNAVSKLKKNGRVEERGGKLFYKE